MLEFEVGAKVWFVDSNSPNVRLLLVVEEIVKKTISGNTREYVFRLMHKGAMKNISGTKLEGNFFSLREDAFNFMHKQAGDAINGMLDKAENSFIKLDTNQKTEIPNEQNEPKDNSDDINGVFEIDENTLENGLV